MTQQTHEPAATGSPTEGLSVRSAAGLLVGLAVVLVALTVVVAARWQPLMHVDHTVARWAFDRTSGHPVLATWWIGLAHVTEPIVLRVLMLLVGLVLLWRGSRFLGGFLVGVALLEQLTGPYAKYVLDRPRPHWTHPLDVLSSTSYPAGHATGIACFATAVGLVAFVRLPAGLTRRLVLGAAAVLVVLVCADRLLLGMHYLSDVAAGFLLGVATTVTCWWVALLVQRRARTSSG